MKPIYQILVMAVLLAGIALPVMAADQYQNKGSPVFIATALPVHPAYQVHFSLTPHHIVTLTEYSYKLPSGYWTTWTTTKPYGWDSKGVENRSIRNVTLTFKKIWIFLSPMSRRNIQVPYTIQLNYSRNPDNIDWTAHPTSQPFYQINYAGTITQFREVREGPVALTSIKVTGTKIKNYPVTVTKL